MTGERSLWEMLIALLQRVKVERAKRKAEREKPVVPSFPDYKFLLRAQVNQYQPFLDQIMDHDPYGIPMLQNGRPVHVEEESGPVTYRGFTKEPHDPYFFCAPEVIEKDHAGGTDGDPPAGRASQD